MLIERFCNVGLSSLSQRPHGHFFKSVVVDEPDDAAAIASAKQLVDGHGSETGKSQNLSKSKNNSEQFRRSFVLN